MASAMLSTRSCISSLQNGLCSVHHRPRHVQPPPFTSMPRIHRHKAVTTLVEVTLESDIRAPGSCHISAASAARRRSHIPRAAAVPSDGRGGGSSSSSSGSSSSSSGGNDAVVERRGIEGTALGDFCIIEGPDTVQDFARMELDEIRDNINSRRSRIFLLMEEVRRLRIQQRVKSAEQKVQLLEEDEEDLPEFPSSIPFFPPVTPDTLRQYYVIFFCLVATIIVFGGLVAPSLELKLGLGGTSYAEFIQSLHLPQQLSMVDPIVASFSGGAVGVLSALMVVEANNVKQQEHKRCMYCYGSGYLVCARCAGSGSLLVTDEGGEGQPAGAALLTADSDAEGNVKLAATRKIMRCPNCAGSSKVMCPTCLCTGMALATEHDPRIDPFD